MQCLLLSALWRSICRVTMSLLAPSRQVGGHPLPPAQTVILTKFSDLPPFSPVLNKLLASLGDDLRFVMITSRASLLAGTGGAATSSGLAGVGIVVHASTHTKCERCWHYRADVGAKTEHPLLCGRCVSNLFGPGEPRNHA